MFSQKGRIEPTDPNLIFKDIPIKAPPDNPNFEANVNFPLDFYYSSQRIAEDEFKKLNQMDYFSALNLLERNRLKPVDPIILNKEFQELDFQKYSHRFNQTITKSVDNFNEISDSKFPSSPDNYHIRIPFDLYQSHFTTFPPKYQAPILMSSPNFAFKSILNDDKHFIDLTSGLIQKEKRQKFISRYLSNRAFGFVSLNIYQKALQDCQAAISNDLLNTFAFFIKGMIHLFLKDEMYAINTWRSALSLEYYDRFSLLMKYLIQDHNIRHKLYTLKDNIKKVIRFIDNYRLNQVYSSDDIQIGYKKLFEGNYYDAMIKLQHVIHSHPHNSKAIIGNAIAVFASEDYLHGTNQFSYLQSFKEIPAEYSKFIGFGYAMLRNESKAVVHLSRTIRNNETDDDAILLRAKLQIQRGLYKSALQDLSSIPIHLQTDQVLVRMAICYMLLGDIPLCVKALHKAKPEYKDSYLFYVWFLLVCEQHDYQSSFKAIQNAVNWDPSFNLLTTAGDYCYDHGMYDDASEFYQKALEKCRNSRVVLRKLAFAFIQNGREIEGLKILKNIGFVSSGGDFNYNSGPIPNFSADRSGGSRQNNLQLRYFDHWMIDFKRIETTRSDRIDARISPFDTLSKSDTTDYRFILYLMNFRDQDFKIATRDKIRDTGQNAVTFLTSKNKLTSDVHTEEEAESDFEVDRLLIKIRMIKEADIIGLKCVPTAFGTPRNPRVIRAMGLAVLCLASILQNEMKKLAEIHDADENYDSYYMISHWTDAFDKIRAILQLADLQKDVKWISQLPPLEPKATSVTSQPVPNECFGFRSRESTAMPKPLIKLDGIFETPFSRTNNTSSDQNTQQENTSNETQLNNTSNETQKNGSKELNENEKIESNQLNENEQKKKLKKKKKVKRKVMKPAPFTRPIRPFTGSPYEDQYIDQLSVPLYYIQNGCRRPPRFQHVSETALKKLAIAAQRQVSVQMKIRITDTQFQQMCTDAKYIYRIVQNSISTNPQICENGFQLEGPSINLTYLGALGYQVFVQSTTTLKKRRRYYYAIEDCWSSLIKSGSYFYTKEGIEHEKIAKKKEKEERKKLTKQKNQTGEQGNTESTQRESTMKIFDVDLENAKKRDAERKKLQQDGNYTHSDLMDIFNRYCCSIPNQQSVSDKSKQSSAPNDDYYADDKLNKHNLSFMMQLIWCLHPFSIYSPELAHIFVHAYLLATKNCEIDKIDSVCEMFITQMVDPNLASIRSALDQLIVKKTESMINEESIEFWDSERSINEIIELLSAKV